MNKLTLYIALPLLAGGLLACNKRSEADRTDFTDIELADTLTLHSRYLTVADNGSYVDVTIADPWKEGGIIAKYALVNVDSAIPEGLPPTTHVVRVPVERSAVFSSVYTSALDELGAIDALSAVADAAYFFPEDTVTKLLKEGRLVDVGQSMNPSVERLAASGAQIVLRSPMEGTAGGKLPDKMVPVECVDYMERSPIGRAEWILLLGELYGRRDEARKIFTQVVEDYSDLSLKARLADSPKPKVLTETEYSGVWYVPSGDSYQARMLADAGADYPWAGTEGSGSLSLSLEAVADKALDADVWLVKSYGYETTPSTLKSLNPRYASFKALKEGNIYSCDTSVRNIFNDVAFHPEKILADYIAIFHPEEMPGYELRYFVRTGK